MRFLLCIVLLSLLVGCDKKPLAPPAQLGKLVVVTREGPATYEIDVQGVPSGFEHDLVKLFAKEIALPVEFITVRDYAEMSAAILEGRAHFGAGSLSPFVMLPTTVNPSNSSSASTHPSIASSPVSSPLAEQSNQAIPTSTPISISARLQAALTTSDQPNIRELRYTAPIRELAQVLVQHEDAPRVEEAQDLAGKTIEVLAGSAAFSTLNTLNPQPLGMRVVPLTGMSEMQLLERVYNRQTDLAAIDSANFQIGANFFPALQRAFVLPGKRPQVWGFRQKLVAQDEDVLYKKAEIFIARIQKDGTLLKLVDRYFGHVQRLNQADTTQFMQKIQTVLPRYRRDFMTAQELNGVDWRLIAALAYQESHWDPLATSFTNVRGMMMLTEDTADHLKVDDRLNPRESILGGARYFSDLRDQLPFEIKEPDRTWIALGAYNLGMGHMNGGRSIAKALKRDANSWYDLKQVLPLMSRPEYAARLKSGSARGGEAVIMVENIRTYYDILVRHEKTTVPPESFSSSTSSSANAPVAKRSGMGLSMPSSKPQLPHSPQSPLAPPYKGATP